MCIDAPLLHVAKEGRPEYACSWAKARSNTCCDIGLNELGMDIIDSRNAVIVGALTASRM